MGDLLMIGGQLAGILAIQIALAHVQRVTANDTRNLVDDGLHGHHALGAAEAAKGRIGHGVGTPAMPLHVDVGQVVGVVAMKHGAVDNGVGEVWRATAARRQNMFDAQDPTLCVEAHMVAVEKIMALAGHHHVIATRQPALGRPPASMRHQRGQACPGIRLGLLAAEAAAHAPHLGGDRLHRQCEHGRHEFLYLGGILVGGHDVHPPVIPGNRQCHLAFQIEVLLATHPHFAGKAVGRLANGTPGITAMHGVRWTHGDARAHRGIDIHHRILFVVLDPGQQRGAPCGAVTGRRHHEQWLAMVLHFLCHQQGITREYRPDIQRPGHIAGGKHTHHAGRRAYRIEIHGNQSAMGDGRAAHRQVQRARGFGQIVNVLRGAGHMGDGAVMHR
jgi:hypothetical protein